MKWWDRMPWSLFSECWLLYFKLKLQYFGHLMQSWLIGKDWCWEGLGAGGERDTRGWDGWMASLIQWMWELDHKEGWMPNNWCFCAVVLEKTVESSLDWKSSNQSNLMEINPEYLLEGLMLKLKLQYFSHLRWRTNSLEKTLMLGYIEGSRRREQ